MMNLLDLHMYPPKLTDFIMHSRVVASTAVLSKAVVLLLTHSIVYGVLIGL